MALRRSAELRAALVEWQHEGLVTTNAVDVITKRYDLDRPPQWFRSSTFMIGLVAALLVTAGLVLFISDHWNDMGTVARMLTGIVPWFASVVMLLRATATGRMRQAEGWAFLASLLFGVNIFLQAQIFHLSGYWPTGVMWWALGTLAMAIAVRSAAVLTLAQILTVSWIGSETSNDHFTPLIVIALVGIGISMRYMLTATTLLGGVAVLCWSIYHLWLTTFAFSFSGFLEDKQAGMVFTLAMLAIACFELAQPVSRRFRDVMISLVWVPMLIMLLVTSSTSHSDMTRSDEMIAGTALIAIAAFLFARRDVIGIAWSVLMAAYSILIYQPSSVQWTLLPIVINILLFVLPGVMIGHALSVRKKSEFMWALLVIVALAFARFMDYFDDYLMGALVFTGAGILLFVANLFWNRRHETT